MQHDRQWRRHSRLGLALVVAAVIAAGGCTSGLGLARGDQDAPATPAGETTTQAATANAPASAAPAGPEVPPPAPDPASVPGADRFGVVATDDFCSAAIKVASAFVGLFNSVYAGQGPELQDQVESALVGIDVLRTVAPGDVAASLDASRSFLSRFRDVLAGSGWNLQAAAQGNPEFFGGSEPDAGFAAMTAVTEAVDSRCGAHF